MKTLHDKESLYYLGIKALFTNKKGEIFLVHDAPKKESEDLPQYWDFPGGRVKDGQTIDETLERELQEELGITNFTMGELFSASNSNFVVNVEGKPVGLTLFIYRCQGDISKIQLSDEHQDYGWFRPAEAAKLLSIKYSSNLTEKVQSL